jgi:hypothetical protein
MGLPAGYAGRVAIIDLSSERSHVQSTEDFFKGYEIDARL